VQSRETDDGSLPRPVMGHRRCESPTEGRHLGSRKLRLASRHRSRNDLAALTASCTAHKSGNVRSERGRRQRCQREGRRKCVRSRCGFSRSITPRGIQAIPRSASSVVKRSIPRSQWAQPIAYTQLRATAADDRAESRRVRVLVRRVLGSRNRSDASRSWHAGSRKTNHVITT